MSQKVLNALSVETDIDVVHSTKDDVLEAILNRWDTLSTKIKDIIVDSLMDYSLTEAKVCFA